MGIRERQCTGSKLDPVQRLLPLNLLLHPFSMPSQGSFKISSENSCNNLEVWEDLDEPPSVCVLYEGKTGRSKLLLPLFQGWDGSKIHKNFPKNSQIRAASLQICPHSRSCEKEVKFQVDQQQTDQIMNKNTGMRFFGSLGSNFGTGEEGEGWMCWDPSPGEGSEPDPSLQQEFPLLAGSGMFS